MSHAIDWEDGLYHAVDDLTGVRQRAALARKLAHRTLGPITAERIARDLEELAGEVDQLRENHQPDGGEWTVVYGWRGTSFGYDGTWWRFDALGVRGSGDNVKRRLWLSPVESIEVGES